MGSVWDSDEADLPFEILEHMQWDANTVVSYCINRKADKI
jgi:hypothetical protein